MSGLTGPSCQEYFGMLASLLSSFPLTYTISPSPSPNGLTVIGTRKFSAPPDTILTSRGWALSLPIGMTNLPTVTLQCSIILFGLTRTLHLLSVREWGGKICSSNRSSSTTSLLFLMSESTETAPPLSPPATAPTIVAITAGSSQPVIVCPRSSWAQVISTLGQRE